MCKREVTIVRETPGVMALLGLIFITLKLCGVIDWAWVWVLAPFWISLAIILGLFIGGLMLIGIWLAVVTACTVIWRATFGRKGASV